MEKDRRINIGLIAWHELSDKIKAVGFEDTLNENIDLSTYGEGVEKYYFTFIVVKPTNTIHEEELFFNPEKKELSISLKLNYEEVEAASKDKMMELMSALFLKGLDQANDLEIPDFDVEKLREDAERLFLEKRWVKEAA